jgi:Ni/Fe-hydrogenase subunit HybB-like protein
LLSKLARAIPYVLGLYLLLKFGELIVQNEIGLLFQANLMTALFWTEIVVGALVPIGMFSVRAVRENPKGLLIGALLVIGGLMLNRFDISLFALNHLGGQSYIPNLLELAVSFGIISGGVLAFGVVAKFFPLFESGEHLAEPVEAKTA